MLLQTTMSATHLAYLLDDQGRVVQMRSRVNQKYLVQYSRIFGAPAPTKKFEYVSKEQFKVIPDGLRWLSIDD